MFVIWEASEGKQGCIYGSGTKPRASCSASSLSVLSAALVICACSKLRTIYIDCQTPCAPFLASAARHNQKTNTAKSTPSKAPRHRA